MEAMASGLPVLTTPNSGSLARDGADGFVHSYDDVEGFRRAIQQLDDDRDLLLRMGESARRRVLDYDQNAYKNQLGEFFRRLVNPSGADRLGEPGTG
jgi:glycosyltransferase involved in cell wall biosynthesis